MYRILCFTLLAPMLVMVLLAPAAQADRLDIRKPAYDQTLAYEAEGYTVKDAIQVGELIKGESFYFDTQLTSGLDYVIHFQGDEGVLAIKLEVFDEHWQLVQEKEVSGGPVVIKLSPEWSGSFHVKATMVDCVDEYDFWFILAGYK